ncbi:MAG: type IV pilus twitching motility protein PilT [Rickettsiales bacterium]
MSVISLNDLIHYAITHKASDLHLTCGHPPILRINGDMFPLQVRLLTHEDLFSMLEKLLADDQMERLRTVMELDFSFSSEHGTRLRVNAFFTFNGPAMVLRLIPSELKTFEELGLPPQVAKLTQISQGLILVTGATGSGKSTSMAAMVDYINRRRACHIITIEDPIEYIFRSNRSVINQREVGEHTKSFSNALRSALREDPDVIMLGELRDKETITLALTAAETGHLVIATLHTNSAPKTVDRIIDVFSEGEKDIARAMLSVSLKAVLTQTLLRRADGSGRVAALELLLNTSAVANLIRDNKIPQITSIMQMNVKNGMITMKDSIDALVKKEIIGPDQANKTLKHISGMEADDF